MLKCVLFIDVLISPDFWQGGVGGEEVVTVKHTTLIRFWPFLWQDSRRSLNRSSEGISYCAPTSLMCDPNFMA